MASSAVPPIIPSDTATSVFDPIAALSSVQQAAIYRPTDPPPGISGFIFDLNGEDTTDLESDITDHYVENNSAIQDQWALKPEIVTVRGEVCELVAYNVAEQARIIAKAQNQMPLVGQFIPALTQSAQQQAAQASTSNAEQTASVTSTNSLYQYYQNQGGQPPNQTKQTQVFGYFYQLWKGRQLGTVETPYGYWTNMAIQSIKVVQPESTRDKSEYTVVFKKIRTASDNTITLGQLAGRAEASRSPVTPNGTLGQTALTASQTATVIAKATP